MTAGLDRPLAHAGRPAAAGEPAPGADASPTVRHRVGEGTDRADAPAFLPIAEHGVIGDMHSVALVGTDGTIDWYCPDRFDAA
ncbi:MAG: hypothetical protein QOG65_3584, partial [Actinomycetota bacterium]|nr:hypothetical protein [Actinomycetota bacterium]